MGAHRSSPDSAESTSPSPIRNPCTSTLARGARSGDRAANYPGLRCMIERGVGVDTARMPDTSVSRYLDCTLIGPGPRRKFVSNVPIAEYALLSDCRSAALVSRAGSVDWLCFPRFDGPSVFARLLDKQAGHWSISTVDATEVSRRYLEGTMVLEST